VASEGEDEVNGERVVMERMAEEVVGWRRGGRRQRGAPVRRGCGAERGRANGEERGLGFLGGVARAYIATTPRLTLLGWAC
jgi:hypothetical protein